MRKIIRFFDRLEDKLRRRLSRRPIVYALVGGVGIVLFWRGVWLIADEMALGSWTSLILSVAIMLITGTFVSFFIGEEILISGLKESKRADQKTEQDLKREEEEIKSIVSEIKVISQDIQEIKNKLNTK